MFLSVGPTVTIDITPPHAVQGVAISVFAGELMSAANRCQPGGGPASADLGSDRQAAAAPALWASQVRSTAVYPAVPEHRPEDQSVLSP